MQQAMDTLTLRGIQYRLHGPWNTGLLRKAREPTLREGVQDVTDSLDTTADMLGNLGWRVALRTGQ